MRRFRARRDAGARARGDADHRDVAGAHGRSHPLYRQGDVEAVRQLAGNAHDPLRGIRRLHVEDGAAGRPRRGRWRLPQHVVIARRYERRDDPPDADPFRARRREGRHRDRADELPGADAERHEDGDEQRQVAQVSELHEREPGAALHDADQRQHEDADAERRLAGVDHGEALAEQWLQRHHRRARMPHESHALNDCMRRACIDDRRS
ncbi:hypothetical protein BN2476_350087 [Paraburkholderia piptadeniae]|uniref:Uncharacterized protein n=1 Tax=Paraburkholderia piptadeniae TaxID=1701573 RepID=A0A1N7S7U8_9BURK|nr:hypothetical protein BN2476_350087 [Paraburkholderia piptadeniae]